MVEPHSEAAPAALLIQFFAAFRNLIERGAYLTSEADKHYTNLFVVLVGQNSNVLGETKGTPEVHEKSAVVN